MTHTRKFSNGHPSTPQTQRIFTYQTGNVAIPNGSWGSLLTLPEFFVRHSPVLCLATIQLDLTANPGTIEFQVTRDGTTLGVYHEEFDNTETAKNRTFHWFDPTPGDSPIYVLQAKADVDGLLSKDATIFTAHM